MTQSSIWGIVNKAYLFVSCGVFFKYLLGTVSGSVIHQEELVWFGEPGGEDRGNEVIDAFLLVVNRYQYRYHTFTKVY